MSRESEEEVLRRIEATRERMGETIERIGDRVHPDRVQHELKARAREQVDELKHNVKRKAKNTMDDVQHGVREKGRGVWDTIRENPLPAGMVGVGLAWLMANGTRHSDDATYRSNASPFDRPGGYDRHQPVPNRYRPLESASYAYDDDLAFDHDFDDDDQSAIGDAADQIRAKSFDALDDARGKGQHAAYAAREKGGELADSAREQVRSARRGIRHAGSAARGWASDAEHSARRAERRVEHAIEDNPFAAGAVAMALGLAAGLMIPESDREREMMGPTRARLKDQAETKAREVADRAHDAVRETASKSAKRAVDEVWSEAGGSSSDGADGGAERMAAEGNAGRTGAVREPGR